MKFVLASDNSAISTFLECPLQWYYTYIKSIGLKGPPPRYFDTGTVAHALLDVYYKNLSVMTQPQAMKYSIEIFEKNRQRMRLGITDPEINFVKERFNLYVGYWMLQGDYKPLIINGKPQVELGFSVPLLDNSYFLFIVEGRIDLLTESGLLVDHKSQAKKYDHYAFDTQFLTYAMATKILKGNVNYFGLQQKLTDYSFRRMPFAFTSQHLERWREKLIKIFYRMYHYLENANDPVFLETERNENACEGKWKPCQFTNICEQVSQESKLVHIKGLYEEKPKWQPWQLEET